MICISRERSRSVRYAGEDFCAGSKLSIQAAVNDITESRKRVL